MNWGLALCWDFNVCFQRSEVQGMPQCCVGTEHVRMNTWIGGLSKASDFKTLRFVLKIS